MGCKDTTQLSKQPFTMYYSDLYDMNFLEGEDSNTYVVDHDQAGVAPLAFMAFTLMTSKNKDLLKVVQAGFPEINLVDTSTIKARSTVQYAYRSGCH